MTSKKEFSSSSSHSIPSKDNSISRDKLEFKNVSNKGILNLKAELSKTKALFDSKKKNTSQTSIVTKQLNPTKFIPVTSSSSPSLHHASRQSLKHQRKKEKKDEEEFIEASRLSSKEWETTHAALLKKQALYESLCQEGAEYDSYLVDFNAKPISATSASISNITTSSSDQPWVKVEDEFGRTRQILASDLPAFQEESQKNSINTSITPSSSLSPAKKEKHYDSTKEVRTLGVSFYQFSQDEEERNSQMQQLKQLRLETLLKRSKLRKEALSSSSSSSSILELNSAIIEKRKQMILEKRINKLGEEQGRNVLWLSDL